MINLKGIMATCKFAVRSLYTQAASAHSLAGSLGQSVRVAS